MKPIFNVFLVETYIRFFKLLPLLIFSLALGEDIYAQKIDCNGKTVFCSRTKKYPYSKCPGPGISCKNYNDRPLSGVLRAPYPICVQFSYKYPEPLLPIYVMGQQPGLVPM